MAYAPAAGSVENQPSGLAVFIAECATFFQFLRAAQRVASAVEIRRRPSPADLDVLGIKGPFPGTE